MNEELLDVSLWCTNVQMQQANKHEITNRISNSMKQTQQIRQTFLVETPNIT
jgi:translation initiation factor IF-1